MSKNSKYLMFGFAVLLGLLFALITPSKSATPSQKSTGGTAPAQFPSASRNASFDPEERQATPIGADLAIAGQVLEVISVPNYVYLRIKTASGSGKHKEVWVAANATEVSVGDQVTLQNAQLMTSFTSNSLKRTFEQIYFGSLAAPDAPQGTPSGANHPPMQPTAGNPHAALGAAPPGLVVTQVDRAQGPLGRTISELYAERSRLVGTPVRVRAMVVKVTSNVLERNFVHVRDGSGDASSNNNDLTVTTTDNTAVGNTVQFEGVLRSNVDFGSGYQYQVLLENGRIVAE